MNPTQPIKQSLDSIFGSTANPAVQNKQSLDSIFNSSSAAKPEETRFKLDSIFNPAPADTRGPLEKTGFFNSNADQTVNQAKGFWDKWVQHTQSAADATAQTAKSSWDDLVKNVKGAVNEKGVASFSTDAARGTHIAGDVFGAVLSPFAGLMKVLGVSDVIGAAVDKSAQGVNNIPGATEVLNKLNDVFDKHPDAKQVLFQDIPNILNGVSIFAAGNPGSIKDSPIANGVEAARQTAGNAIRNVTDTLLPQDQPIYYHGTTPANAASIRTNGFNLSHAQGGAEEPKVINLTTDKTEALRYGGVKNGINGGKGEAVPVQLKGNNGITFNNEADYIGAVESKYGDYTAQNAEKFINQYDHVIVKGVGKSGSDNIFVGNPQNITPLTPEKASSIISDKATQIAVNNEKAAWEKPTTIPKSSYTKATDILNSAKERGTDIPETLVNNGIKLSDNIQKSVSGKVYNTLDTAEEIRTDAARASNEMLRPALQKADAANLVPKTPVSELINDARANINAERSLTVETKASLLDKLQKTETALQEKYPEGMNLTELHDEKIVRDLNSKYSPVGDIGTNIEAAKNKAIADAARKMVEEKAPPEIPVNAFNDVLTKQFRAADYLDALHGKAVPRSIVSRIASMGAKVVGATVGHGLGGGVLGGVGGYHLGGMVESLIEGLPNPIKNAFLKNLQITNPEAFDAVSKFLSTDIPVAPETPLTLPKHPEAPVQEMDMGTYKLRNNPVSGKVEPTGQYRKPGVNFYPKK